MSPTLQPANVHLDCECARYVEHSLRHIVVFHRPTCPSSSTGEQRLFKPKVGGSTPPSGSSKVTT